MEEKMSDETFSSIASEHYRNTFPSDKFLQKYFGDNVELETQPNYPKPPGRLYDHLRKAFDDDIRHVPALQIRIADSYRESFKKFYSFRNATVVDLSREKCEENGLLLLLDQQGEADLYSEFLTHLKCGALYADSWWSWNFDEHTASTWIEITASANPEGGNRPKRSLSEMLKGE